MKGGPFGDIKKIAKKSVTKPKKPAQKFLVNVGLEPTSSAWQTSEKP